MTQALAQNRIVVAMGVPARCVLVRIADGRVVSPPKALDDVVKFSNFVPVTGNQFASLIPAANAALSHVAKFNPYHDELGRFAEANAAAAGQAELFPDIAARGLAHERAQPWRPDDDWDNVSDDADLIDTSEKFDAFLTHYKAEAHDTMAGEAYTLLDGKTTMVAQFVGGVLELKPIDEFVNEWDVSDEVGRVQVEFDADFWRDGPETLYHGTEHVNLQTILDDGIETRDEKRGTGNRWLGPAVFTHPDTDLPSDYADSMLSIDMKAWREDVKRGAATRWTVQREPTAVELEVRSNLAWDLGWEEYQPDDYSGEDPETVIFHGGIPGKYIRVQSAPGSRRKKKATP